MSSNTPFTAETHADREIASQPDIWRKVAAMAPSVAGLLPAHGERVAAVGCGSSWFMSMAYAGIREGAGHGETDYFAGSEFLYERKYDRIVAISRSGTTTETVELLKKTKLPSVIITAVAGSPVTEYADESIILDFADEESVVQTRWATAALGLLRAHNGTDLLPLADQCELALAADIAPFLEVELLIVPGLRDCRIRLMASRGAYALILVVDARRRLEVRFQPRCPD